MDRPVRDWRFLLVWASCVATCWGGRRSFVSAAFTSCHAARPWHSSSSCIVHTRHYGIAEWRGQYDGASSVDDDEPVTNSLLLLPMAPSHALLPGQYSDTIILKEGRWFDLLDEAVEDHHHVIGTSLMGPDGLLPILPLCEIDHYELMAGYRGKVTASIRLKGVGRAKLIQLEQLKPIMMGRVQELYDDDRQAGSVLNVLNELESLLNDCGRLDQYQAAYQSALSVTKSAKGSSSLSCSDLDKQEAASWAATIVALSLNGEEDKLDPRGANESFHVGTSRYQALSSINAWDRLQVAISKLIEATSFR